MSESDTQRWHPVRTVAVAVGVIAIAFVALLIVTHSGSEESADSNLLGNPAPVVEAELLNGDKFNLSHRKGSWVLLNFFNSTCVPCIREHPELVKFAEAESKIAEPAELYTVINDDSDAAIENFFDKNGGSWPKVKDDNGTIAVAFGVAKVPETWIIDPNGFVRMRIAGEVTADFLNETMANFRSGNG